MSFDKIKQSKHFLRCFNLGNKIYTKYFILFYVVEKKTHFSVGIVTSRKVGKAHQRNRARRRIRTLLINATNRELLPNSGYLVLVAKKTIASASFATIKQDLLLASNKLQRIAQKNENATDH